MAERPTEPINIVEPNLLVVEGEDENRFFGALISHLGLRSIQVLPIGGKEKLPESLKALVVSPGFHEVHRLNVVRDADDEPSRAFQSVCKALENAGLPSPKSPIERTGDTPEVTVMIMPGQGGRGALEDLCLKAVVDDPAMTCVDEFFECLQSGNISHPKNTPKAKVQTFLASIPHEGLRLGEAAEKGYWPWHSEAFKEVKDFLAQMVS